MRRPAGGDVPADDDANYSIMAADDVSVTSAGRVLGEVVARGRLVDREAQRLGGFTQTTRVRRGSRIIELEIELDVGRQPGPGAWQSYYAARFAWSDATANLYRSVNMANLPTDAVQLETPHFVDVRAGKVRTTLLCGGLPYHRRFGLRKLDTLLVVRGERSRRFRLGIGIDVPHPMAAALDFLAPKAVVSGVHCPTVPAAWLFHLDARNVVATHWEPIVEEDCVAGLRVRLLETDGLDVALALRCLRPIVSAHKAPLGEAAPQELPIDDDCITVALHPHEWADVEARFAV
jgi:alpha-mannosidase